MTPKRKPAKQTHCSQCGKTWRARACGPTHAAISAAGGDPSKVELGRKPAKKVRRVRAMLSINDKGAPLDVFFRHEEGSSDLPIRQLVPCVVTYAEPTRTKRGRKSKDTGNVHSP